MPEGDVKLSVDVSHEECRSQVEHWFEKDSTAGNVEAVGKAPVTADVNNTDNTESTDNCLDHLERLTKVKTKIDSTLVKFEERRTFQETEMAKMTIIDVMNKNGVNARDRLVWATVILAMRSVIENNFDERVVADPI